jgi:hypothetical protein
MLGAAVGGVRRSVDSQGPEIVLDVSGRRVSVSRAEAHRLQEAASLEAGRSSVARDLALLLDRALAGGSTLALRRGEAHTLTRLSGALGLSELVARLSETS